MASLDPRYVDDIDAVLSKYGAPQPQAVNHSQLASEALAGPVVHQAAPVAEQSLNAPGSTWASAPEVAPMNPAPVPQSAPVMPVQTVPEPVTKRAPTGATINDQLARWDQAKADATSAERQLADAEGRSSDAQAQILREQREAMAQSQKAAQERAAQHAEETAKAESDLADYEKQAKQIGDHRTNGQKVAAIIGMAFAGIGDGFARMGGNNDTRHLDETISLVNQAVARDIDNQRKNLEQGKDTKVTALRLAQQKYQDEGLAQQAATLSTTQQYALSLQEAAATMSNPIRKAEAEKALVGLGIQIEQQKQDLIQTEMSARARRHAGAGAGAPKPGSLNRGQLEALEQSGQITGDQAKALKSIRDAATTGRKSEESAEDRAVKAATDPARAATERGARLSTDLIVADPKIAPLHAKGAEKLQSGVDTARNMLAKIERIKQLRAANPAMMHVPYSDARAELEQIHGDLIIDAKNVAELGALSGPDMGLVTQMLGDPTGWTSASDKKFESAEETLRTKVNQQLSSRGFEPVMVAPKPSRGSSAAQTERVKAATTAEPARKAAPIFGTKVAK